MKNLLGILWFLTLGMLTLSCSSDDDDPDMGGPSTKFFMWDVGGTTHDAVTTSTFDGVGLYISAQDKNDGLITMEIRSRTSGEGTYILNKNDGDADDDQTMVLKMGDDIYITTEDHSVEFNISSINSQQKEIEGTFGGEVVNEDDPSDVVTILNGAFLIIHF